MGENEVNLPNTSLQGKKMAYQKVSAEQRASGHSQYLDNDDLQGTALDLEWDMEKELEEPGFDQFQLDSAESQNLGHSETVDLNLHSIQPAISPKGRFQRLQEESDYLTHCTLSASKSNHWNIFHLLKILCIASLFIFGILIGYYSHTNCPSDNTSSGMTNPQLYHEILKTIQAEDIKKSFRNLVELYESEDGIDISKTIKTHWTSLGLEDVQFVNYSVLLSLPGSAPSTVTLSNSSQCFHPDGQPCSEEARKDSSQDLLSSYAAYSAKGTLKAEVIDVSYGTIEDLRRIKKMKNTTNQIALLKLGKLPLLYKIFLLENAGFGGVLLYIDPCDLPKTKHFNQHDTFMVTLNPGGDPTTPGYASIDGSFRQSRSDLTSLLVQPISASLVAKLISAPTTRSKGDMCSPLELSSNEIRIVSMQVQTVTKFNTVTNVFGYVKGLVSPDRYVLVGSHHATEHSYKGHEWASSTAIITSFIRALMSKVKRGWRPDRTIVFCSWGGTTFGNIGSYEWGENFKNVLQKNVVAYISLHSPIRGNSSLHSVASPSLQQLVVEKNNFNCTRRAQCPETNVSSAQIQGDADYFINHLGVPTLQFAYEDIKALEGPSFLTEAVFPKHATKIEEMDPFFNLHETISKLTGEVILQISNEPVLPFNALDIALAVQNSLKGDQPRAHQLLALASRLRDHAELFQSDEMRPANNPKERVPMRVRMLNDILQDMEKSFLVDQVPPGFYRNILYHIDEKASQFSILREAWEHCEPLTSNETLQEALSDVLNSINSAQVYFKAGLDVFESVLVGKN